MHSQVIYTDIIPDAIPSASYSLDLNNDSISDFYISLGQVGIKCFPENNNAYSGEFARGSHLPWALSASQNICASL